MGTPACLSTVPNMPGGVARTSTIALTNATSPFVIALANKGAERALLDDKNLLNGLNVHRGMVTCDAVAQALGYDYVTAVNLLTEFRRSA